MSPLFMSSSSLTRHTESPSLFSDIHFDRTSDIIGSEVGLDLRQPSRVSLFESPRILMFVIERGIDEAIVVGDTVIRILEVRFGEVRLAISSPDGPRYREVVIQCQTEEEEAPLFADSYDESLSFFA